MNFRMCLQTIQDFANCTVIEHEIHVTPDFKPRMTKAHRVPETLKIEIERQVDELLKLRFIVPSKSPMASGVVCVLKPDNAIRMTCDYRYLNSYTMSDAFPMPNLRCNAPCRSIVFHFGVRC